MLHYRADMRRIYGRLLSKRGSHTDVDKAFWQEYALKAVSRLFSGDH